MRKPFRAGPGLCQSRLTTIDLTGGRPVVLWWQSQARPPTCQANPPGVTLEKPWPLLTPFAKQPRFCYHNRLLYKLREVFAAAVR